MNKELHWYWDLDTFNDMVIQTRELIVAMHDKEFFGNKEECEKHAEFLVERIVSLAPYLVSAYYISNTLEKNGV
jgi:hypothetical protein